MTTFDPSDLLAADDVQSIVAGNHPDPFSVLGPRLVEGEPWVVAHVPGAERLWAVNDDTTSELTPYPGAPSVFVGRSVPFYQLRAHWPGGATSQWPDPYSFGPVLGEVDEYLIGEGTHGRLWHVLGAHTITHEGVEGVHFAVWAPNARRVSVVGDFNVWNATTHPMRLRGSTGVWELFVPGLGEGSIYKYDLLGPDGRQLPLKADPVGFGSEHPPLTGSVVRALGRHTWNDEAWLSTRAEAQRSDAPISIYEVHLGSWRRVDGDRPLSYLELARDLVDYVADLGFTHLEVMPVSEYPFSGSWGYQPIGLFAPTIRYGTPAEFAAFVDAAHERGLGVLADWVPGHFPTDEHGLGRFDGTALYEHADPREGFHPDWNTLIYNYGRPEVVNYLVSNALYWLDEYHLDGLRVDAVASMLYRDYSRPAGQWIPNKDGGRDNYEAISFLQAANVQSYGQVPGIMTVAEESTTFDGVTRRVDEGGLGFGFKWNIGWMNDSLQYFGKEPIHRKFHHDLITFGITYAFTENFVLPISHDEVVHGKGSMYGRMPGSAWDKLANLRAFYGYMWSYPGKKLLFMGQEFGQPAEWNHDAQLDWGCLDDPGHAGVRNLVRDLNRVYREVPALHVGDSQGGGFRWLVVDDRDASVFVYLREGAPGDPRVVVALNLTPIERSGYRLGFPAGGYWRELLNSDGEHYGGGNRGNLGGVQTEAVPAQAEAQSALVTLPPLSAVYFIEEGS